MFFYFKAGTTAWSFYEVTLIVQKYNINEIWIRKQ